MLDERTLELASEWYGVSDPRHLLNAARRRAPARPDLTARQIEWCRANIPMFAEMQRLRGVK